ncbi:MAG: rod-binding protein [Desulfobulbus sp.]|jgi:flagellar protein FlgJ|uniref:rod-binding protein n=1 Tax=Desulfobulbus sp. TaxID=895 RepID=UPI00284C6CAA|nr:rod-binding protein [Desulfobulbus sp.]MDR2550745.1 rod-binding protein [Desulfobulbus sp.]
MTTNIDSKLLLQATSQATTTQPTPKDKAALKKTCQDFEAIFIQSMFKAMRKSVVQGGLMTKNNATAIFEEMFDQNIATDIAKKQSFGLADQMYRQMEKNLPTDK